MAVTEKVLARLGELNAEHLGLIERRQKLGEELLEIEARMDDGNRRADELLRLL